MSPRTQEQYEEIRENRKFQIMETALELFANQGYYATSISMIAKKAGISKGLMYNYFSSKEELVKTIIYIGFEQIINLMDQDRNGEMSSDEIEYFINESFAMVEQNFQFWKLFMALLLQPSVSSVVSGIYAEAIPRVMETFKGYFVSMNSDDPEMEAWFYGALMDGISLNYVMNPDSFPLEGIKKLLIKKLVSENKNTLNNSK